MVLAFVADFLDQLPGLLEYAPVTRLHITCSDLVHFLTNYERTGCSEGSQTDPS